VRGSTDLAEISISPTSDRNAWLDRPLAPSWQRLTALVAHWELIAYAAIFLLGFTLRIWDVGARAMHHDESLHAYYAWKFFVGQGYSYDPLMHGPLQFEVVPLFYLLFGASEFSARLLAVSLGTGLIVLPYFLRSYLTRPGALLTSLMIGVSPGMVYFSRFIRDDIYLAFFSLLLFTCIVLYIEAPRPAYLHIAAAAMALAMASMEAAYITFFIFGTFLLIEWVREYLSGITGPVNSALKATSLDTFLTSLSIFVVITVLTYSTFFTNPYGIWDTQHSILSPDRKDILGGLTYWKAQHSVARGGQPWFYYLLVLPLYEQLAVVFGIAGVVYAAVRRSFTSTLLVWWALVSLGMYSWAGEKMPWLSIHITLPFILLAGLFLGAAFESRKRMLWLASLPVFLVLLFLEIHSTFMLNYVDAANPTEMLIYVQTSQDVPTVVAEVNGLANKTGQGKNLPIGLDNTDVGGWPFIWYLRDYKNVSETSAFGSPACNGQLCSALMMLEPQYDANSAFLLKHYVVQKYRWNWWFPEDYKQWFPDHATALGQNLQGKNSAVQALPTGAELSSLWNWMIYRQPFGLRGARQMYFLVRRDLVPGQRQFSSTTPSTQGTAPTVQEPTLQASVRTSFGSAPGNSGVRGPRGLAVGAHGDIYVADPLGHRVVHYSSTGSYLGSWGKAGGGPGQFSLRDSPQGLAVGPDGNVYVVDTWNQRIEVFSPSGKFLRQWGGGPIGSGVGQYYGPRGIAVSDSGRVYIADTGNKRIQVYTTHGRYITSWGTAGTAPGQFQEPSSLAVAKDGTVYVSDFWNQRMQAFTSSGTYLRAWKVLEWTFGSYDEPYVSLNAAGTRVFATQPQQQRVAEFTTSGRLLGVFGSSSLTTPVGVAALPNGLVAVSDSGADAVRVFSVSGGAPKALHSGHRASTKQAPKP
jgi:uncharacterized protein (TIGR03663 family)